MTQLLICCICMSPLKHEHHSITVICKTVCQSHLWTLHSVATQSTTVELIPRSAYELAVIMPIYSNSTMWPVTCKSCKDLKFLCFTNFTVLLGYILMPSSSTADVHDLLSWLPSNTCKVPLLLYAFTYATWNVL